MKLKIRRTFTIVEERRSEAGRDGEVPLRKVAVVSVIENPYAGRYVEDLSEMIAASPALGEEMAGPLAAMAPYGGRATARAALSALAGEQEHANALLTTTFATPLRDVIGGADGLDFVHDQGRRAGHADRHPDELQGPMSMCARTTTA